MTRSLPSLRSAASKRPTPRNEAAMTPAAWFGVWLLVGSAIVIAIELAVMSVWSLRLSRRGRVLARSLQNEQAVITADMARLQAALEETRMLWKPYARVLRWLRHPLVVALMGSY